MESPPAMQDNMRTEKERKFWSESAPNRISTAMELGLFDTLLKEPMDARTGVLFLWRGKRGIYEITGERIDMARIPKSERRNNSGGRSRKCRILT